MWNDCSSRDGSDWVLSRRSIIHVQQKEIGYVWREVQYKKSHLDADVLAKVYFSRKKSEKKEESLVGNQI